MYKLLVETTGSFGLTDFGQKVEISHMYPTVVVPTTFVTQRIGLNQLKLLGKLRLEADNDELMKYIKESEGDMALAVQSFMSSFGFEEFTTKGDNSEDTDETEETEEPEKKKRGRPKKATAEPEANIE